MWTGIYPTMWTGIYPTMWTGIYPPMWIGIYPPMWTGIYPPMWKQSKHRCGPCCGQMWKLKGLFFLAWSSFSQWRPTPPWTAMIVSSITAASGITSNT